MEHRETVPPQQNAQDVGRKNYYLMIHELFTELKYGGVSRGDGVQGTHTKRTSGPTSHGDERRPTLTRNTHSLHVRNVLPGSTQEICSFG